MRTSLIVLLALGTGLSAVDAAAHPAILRWNFEATILSLEGNTSARFPGMQMGDDLRGTLSYDLTAPGVDLPLDPGAPDERRTSYDFAPSLALITVVFENPRTGDVLHYRPGENGGILVADELDLQSIFDLLTLSQFQYAPTAPTVADVSTDVLFFGGALNGTDLPADLDVDDWVGATIYLSQFFGGQVTAEIGLLTPVDVPFVPGDFNGDGAVDAADLGIWQFANGSIDANLAADANGDNRVDGADFLAWQRGFGTAASANAPVPEPRTSLLVIAAAVGTRRIGGRFRQETR